MSDGITVEVEVRAVNNRHLKVTVRGSDPYPMLESEFEKVARRVVKRGTVQVHVRITRASRAAELSLNIAVLKGYVEQVCGAVGPTLAPAVLAGVLSLPGVAAESTPRSAPPEEEWPVVEKAFTAALAKLNASRREEGRAMADELLALHATVKRELAAVGTHLPAVMADYRARLLDRVRTAVADAGVTVEETNVIREVAMFADRTDVSEEVTRLTAHLEQFADVVANESDAPGRRLEFVVQEMGRETNTLGSKAGDVTISRHVFEIKAALEKIRELVQNVE